MVSINGIRSIVSENIGDDILDAKNITNIIGAFGNEQKLGEGVDPEGLRTVLEGASGLSVDQTTAYLYQMLSLVDSDPHTEEVELETDGLDFNTLLATKLGVVDNSAVTLTDAEWQSLSSRLGNVADVFMNAEVELEGKDTADVTDDKFTLTRLNSAQSAPIDDGLQSVFEILGLDGIFVPDNGVVTFGYNINGTSDPLDDFVGVISSETVSASIIDDTATVEDTTTVDDTATVEDTTTVEDDATVSETTRYTRDEFEKLITKNGEVDYEELVNILVAMGASEQDAKILADNLKKSGISLNGIFDALDDDEQNITMSSIQQAIAKAVPQTRALENRNEVTKALSELKSSLALIGVNGDFLDEVDPSFILSFYERFVKNNVTSADPATLQVMLDGNGDGKLDDEDKEHLDALSPEMLNIDTQLEELSSLDFSMNDDKQKALKIIQFSGVLKPDNTAYTLEDLPSTADEVKDLVMQSRTVTPSSVATPAPVKPMSLL